MVTETQHTLEIPKDFTPTTITNSDQYDLYCHIRDQLEKEDGCPHDLVDVIIDYERNVMMTDDNFHF